MERFYRKWTNSKDLIAQEVIVSETDLLISAEKDIKEPAEKLIKKFRAQIEDYIKKHPEFKTSLVPLELPRRNLRQLCWRRFRLGIIKDMLEASKLAGVGPMAAIAGAIAEYVGKGLLSETKEIIVENGGDIFIKSEKERHVAIFAGDSPLSNKLSIKVKAQDTPCGICTSSGTVGHSLSFGKADACVIISKSVALADAVATAACNRVKTKHDIKPALEFATSIKGIQGALIVLGKDFGVSGNIELK
ncbi:MAG: UPF0280 family protein [Candidatus Gorgyraea atricola]|nr:UPF0280 family protein [Candidatus Gorgyraea atricola]